MLLLWPPVHPSSLTDKLIFPSTSPPSLTSLSSCTYVPKDYSSVTPTTDWLYQLYSQALWIPACLGVGDIFIAPHFLSPICFVAVFFLIKVELSLDDPMSPIMFFSGIPTVPCLQTLPNSGCQEGESSYFLSSSALPNCCFTILSHTFFEVHDITHSYSTPFMILPHTHQQLDHSFLLFCGYCNNLYLQVPPSKAIGKTIFHPVSLVLFVCKLLIKAICSQFPLP